MKEDPLIHVARSSHDPWTAQEDRLLIRLLTFRTPWAGIGVTIQRPVEELKRRWMFLRDGMPPGVEDGIENDRKRTKHVSFADPLVIGGDVGKTLSACLVVPTSWYLS